jgi:hypothetical protein
LTTSTSTSTSRRVVRGGAVTLVVALALTLAACGSDGPAKGAETSFAKSFCPKVMAWSDGSVFKVNAFQDASDSITDPAQRKARYLQAFDDLQANADAFQAALAKVDYSGEHATEIQRRMADAISRIRAEYADDRKEAEGFDATSYRNVGVNNGHLVTGNEKAKAIVFSTVGSLWEDFDIVDQNCGRHPPVTMISPPAT